MSRRLLLLGLSVVCGVLALASAASARGLQVSVAQGASFPNRVLVLTLPQRETLTSRQVQITEDGRPVRRLSVTPGDQTGSRTFGVILAIDTSQSMHGQAIAQAMAAARAFSARRPANQQLGVIFFNHAPSVVLPMTTDPVKIGQTLAQAPVLHKGTRIFDAAGKALQLLGQSGVSAGSVVILSDGADVGSASSLSAVAGAARAKHVRVFTVGLRSPSFDSSSLKGLAASAGGSYGEAASAGSLAGIFSSLATRFANEYLVRYQSLSALGAHVGVTATVAGLAGHATTTYTAPAALPQPTTGARVTGTWGESWLTAAVAIVFALLLGFAIYALVRPKAPDVRSRVAGFVPEPERLEDLLPGTSVPTTAVLRGADERLSQYRWWDRFKLDVEIGRVDVQPARLALGAVVAGLAGALLSAVIVGNVGLAVVFLLVPVAVFIWVRARADRQRRTFDEQLPDNLQVIASGMRSGQSFIGAMDMAATDADEPARSEFQRIVADDQLGVPLATAVRRVAERMRSTEFEYVGLVAQLQRQTGGNTAEVIDRVTETIRDRAQIRRSIRTLTAQGRLSGAVVSLLPVAIGLIISVSRPHYLDPMFHSTAGTAAIVLAGVGIVAGWLVIRRVVDIKV
jgi:Flp pilus assembly protein TadB/Mg-chelatase subunit ChlD